LTAGFSDGHNAAAEQGKPKINKINVAANGPAGGCPLIKLKIIVDYLV
jgi:hypothetical protein